MLRFLEALILIPIAVVLVLLAVANREPVLISLDPFSPQNPMVVLQIPLYWLVFATFAAGVVIGGVFVWLRQGRYRRSARRERAEARRLRRTLDETEAKAAPARPELNTLTLPAGAAPLSLPGKRTAA
ncbi:lipopolysaccharide assembly protein LapA domain-containing protein [Segnochrobactraceae bacterium EtOH-i3]